MELNFDATVRMTEALLPLLRSSAPSSIVNVSSTAGRVARPGAGAYSASKYALTGWTDSLYSEEKPHDVHVGLVLPGFIETEGFPATELKAKAATRWLVSDAPTAAAAIVDAGIGGKAERYVPRGYALAAVARIVMPRLVRRVLSGGAAKSLTTATGPTQPSAPASPPRSTRPRAGLRPPRARVGGPSGRPAGVDVQISRTRPRARSRLCA